MKTRFAYFVDLSGVEVPEWIQLLPLGEFRTCDSRKLKLVLTKQGAEQIISAFEALQNDMVIDYEHLPHFKPTPENNKAAGWIKQLELRDDGLYARVEWTPVAATAIKNKEYKYVSPSLITNKDGVIIELIDAAITNNPAIDGMTPLTLAANNNEKEDDSMLEAILKALGLAEDATEEQALAKIAELKDGTANTETLSALRSKLGLKDEDGEQVMLSALDTIMKSDNKVPVEITQALSLSADVSIDTVVGSIRGHKEGSESVVALKAEVDKMKEDAHEKKCVEFVEQAIKDGKLTPAQRDTSLAQARASLETFSAYIEASPAIHLGSTGAADADKDDLVTLSAEQQAMNAKMGISDEDYKKYGRM